MAAASETIPLWPDGPPRALEGVGPEIRFMTPRQGGGEMVGLRNVSTASLTALGPDPAKANGIGVIVLPGGGWRILSWDHEGVELAAWLARRGYAAFVLKYRLAATPADPAAFQQATALLFAPITVPFTGASAPRTVGAVLPDEETRRARAIAADDARRALEVVRSRAAEFGVDPARIGMVGFSAGAFATIDAAMAPGDAAPMAFAAAIYGGETGGAPVPADAPPLFTIVAQDDRAIFRIVEGLYADWTQADRPAELHVFARGGHGFGTIRRGLPIDRWLDLFADWLADRGFA